MNKIEVRKADPSDALDLAKIHVETWQCAYKGQVPADYLAGLSIEKRKKTWEENLAKSDSKIRTFVAELDSVLAGFCSVGKSRDDDADEETGELMGIYVGPQFSNQGVGSVLMQTGLDYLNRQGFKKVTLWVLTSNQQARSFYEHKGWIADGKTKTEPRDGFSLHETRYEIKLWVYQL